jgi:two-component system CheB/CheR fusion protein
MVKKLQIRQTKTPLTARAKPSPVSAPPAPQPDTAAKIFPVVVIQHLDPDHKGIMPELLQRTTPMPVAQAKNRSKVLPDHVYVIPPNKDISILRGTLYLLDPVAKRGLRLPIDFLLRTLADDRQNCAVGVILSGIGSDGTLGVRAIKENGVLVLAQEPAEAKFDGMMARTWWN